jgi:propanol-preferring alcohol dehydrogenase
MSQTATETATHMLESFQVPKQCKAGVVVNEGPNFRVVSFGSS